MTTTQLIADFYLKLLAIPATSMFRITHQDLYGEVLRTLAWELSEDNEIVQNIFERMVQEDSK